MIVCRYVLICYNVYDDDGQRPRFSGNYEATHILIKIMAMECGV